MSFLEAIHALEASVAKLGIKHRDKTPMPPVCAMGRIGAYHGARYDLVIDSLEAGQISIEQYFLEMAKMIKEYQMREREIQPLHLQNSTKNYDKP